MSNVMPDSTGDKMEDKKRLDPTYLEQLAEEEYRALAGKLVRVRAINGYFNETNSDTFMPDMLGKPVIVRISEKQNICRWMDEWLDPAYSVEIVERGDLPVSLGSCWIYGNCRSLDGEFEPGDIWAVEPTCQQIETRAASDEEYLSAVKLMDQSKRRIDPHELAERLGGKVCDPPQRYRHLMGFMAKRDRGAMYERAMELSDQLTGRKPSEAIEVYDQLADRKREALDSTTKQHEPLKKPSLEEIVDSLRDRISALEAKCAPRHAIYRPPRFK